MSILLDGAATGGNNTLAGNDASRQFYAGGVFSAGAYIKIEAESGDSKRSGIIGKISEPSVFDITTKTGETLTFTVVGGDNDTSIDLTYL